MHGSILQVYRLTSSFSSFYKTKWIFRWVLTLTTFWSEPVKGTRMKIGQKLNVRRKRLLAKGNQYKWHVPSSYLYVVAYSSSRCFSLDIIRTRKIKRPDSLSSLKAGRKGVPRWGVGVGRGLLRKPRRNLRLETSDFKLQTSDFRLTKPVGNAGFLIFDFRLNFDFLCNFLRQLCLVRFRLLSKVMPSWMYC